MDTTQYNADEALAGARGKVMLRGKEYLIVDLSVRDRIALEIEFNAVVAELESAGETVTQDTLAAFTVLSSKHQRLAVALVLDGVPDDVADSLTERELASLVTVHAHWRECKVPDGEAMLGKQAGPEDGSSKEP